MQTTILKTEPLSPDSAVIAEAARALAGGQLVVFPTETVYGIAADVRQEDAVRRLREAKGRSDTKPLPLMVAGPDDLAAYARDVPEDAYALARAFWPGPLTLILHANARVPEAVHAGTGRVGLRAPDHPVAQAILAAAGGALALTSANRSGEDDTTSAQAAMDALGGRVALIVDAGEAREGRPSTVLDLTASPPRILRQGGITADHLQEVLPLVL